jgi:tRNA(fMet)-specific endonuclease VapC
LKILENPEFLTEKLKVLIKYLLDTNICIFFFKGKFSLSEKIETIGLENCYISEVTLAELKYGAENSNNPSKHHKIIAEFQEKIQIIPIFNSIEVYAKEKARLRKAGTLIDDFDLLIGATAIYNDLTLVTNNLKHFNRLTNLNIEDWTSE